MLPSSTDYNLIEAGCDEAGRGCLAGPVVAAAVILPSGFSHELIRDSKKLSEDQRERARTIIMANALEWGVGMVSAAEIDRINILNASILAMHRALECLSIVPEHIVIDGNRFKPWNMVPYTTVVKGDAKLGNIAAASILAKTFRDDILTSMHRCFPFYGFKEHKGYPTVKHRNAVAEHGVTPWHRYTFAGVKEFL